MACTTQRSTVWNFWLSSILTQPKNKPGTRREAFSRYECPDTALFFKFLFWMQFSSWAHWCSKEVHQECCSNREEPSAKNMDFARFPVMRHIFYLTAIFSRVSPVLAHHKLHLRKSDPVPREWVHCWWRWGRGGSPPQAIHPCGVLQQHSELAGKEGGKQSV